MAINWNDLRTLNNSQNSAFEELCCQLAAYEVLPPGSKFVRKGPPDAGVECFWKLPNGAESCWQAKFFQQLGNAQWAQLDSSVETALDKHPQLTTYTICLPLDRRDPRIAGRTDMAERWDQHVKKWQAWAQNKGMSVEFVYWGEHELWERLSREEHRGRFFFWFNREFFSRKWFENLVAVAIANAGPRYTPELHVGLPIAALFDGLGRTAEFLARINNAYDELRRSYAKLKFGPGQADVDKLIAEIREDATHLFPILESVREAGVGPIDVDRAAQLALQIQEKAWEALGLLDERKAIEKKSDKKGPELQPDLGFRRHLLSALADKAGSVAELTGSTQCRLANTSALAIVGQAGTGKSHLFCDVAKNRAKIGAPTLLLLGENFSNDDPWFQIIKMLGLNCTRSEFLGALEASAQAANSKCLILVDALNEGEGKTLWKRTLAGILTTLAAYPWIGLAVSARSSYETSVIPQGLEPQKLIREEHIGFADHEYQATATFFDHYGIRTPSIPLLNPEFQNPLFLKLFCKGLHNAGHSQMPAGLQGVTAVFDFFLQSVNDKLSEPHLLDFDSALNPVQTAVEKLVDEMTKSGHTWLPRQEAQEVINGVLPAVGYDKSLFRHLLSEGVIAEDSAPGNSRGEWVDSVHFSYERLSDHLITKRLLDIHLDLKDPHSSFEENMTLGALTKDHASCWANRGIIEALCIQLPERLGLELFDCAPRCADWRAVLEAFIASLVWRSPEAFGDTTLQYVNELIIDSEELRDEFIDALITVCSNPEHPYNAEFLHRNLEGLSLPDRDAEWSIYLHNRYTHHEHGSVNRLIEWAWSETDKRHIGDESIRLYAIALSWFLTSSNRFARDRATKGLVALLTPRLDVLRSILHLFRDVNDPYVAERLYAVAYGCALRSNDVSGVQRLASDTYDLVFKGGSPPVHLLLRDYARGVIEVALSLGADLQLDLNKIKPPYGSEWNSDVPSKEEIRKRYDTWIPGRSDDEIAQSEIVRSVMGHEDFARYVIGTNSGHFDWTSRRLAEAHQPTLSERYEHFVDSLTARQKNAFEKLSSARDNFRLYKALDEKRRLETFSKELNEENFQMVIDVLEKRLRATLGKRKLKDFDQYVIQCLDDPTRGRHHNDFDLSLVQRWIVKRVFELGWTKERFGRFDRYVRSGTRDYRTAHKAERIGKKYQWIAYHELLARIADNFEYRSESWTDEKVQYEGPWQPSERNIDPSSLLKKTEREVWKHHSHPWWFPVKYPNWGNDWNGLKADTEWLKREEDIPPVERLLETINPEDGSAWLTLDAYYQWAQPIPLGEDPSATRRKEFWYFIHGYIVKKAHLAAVFEWAKTQDFFGRWMPESHALYEVFLGEFFWAPAYEYYNVPYYHRDGWTRGHNDRIPHEVLLAAEEYTQEDRGFDCSMDEGYSINLPSKWVADGMALKWNGNAGHFYDSKGELAAFDPSVKNKGPGALLVNKTKFLQFLSSVGCEILWTVMGEKSDYNYGSHGDDVSGRLFVNGVYRIVSGTVEGACKSTFNGAR